MRDVPRLKLYGRLWFFSALRNFSQSRISLPVSEAHSGH
jgi:hypothetical protein